MASLEQSEQSTSALPPLFPLWGGYLCLRDPEPVVCTLLTHVVRASRDRLRPKDWPVSHPILGDAVPLPNILRSEETVRSFCFTRFAYVSITHLTRMQA